MYFKIFGIHLEPQAASTRKNFQKKFDRYLIDRTLRFLIGVLVLRV